MKNIYLDCFSGISGNLFIGAMIDAGVPFEHLKANLKCLSISDEYKLITDIVFRNSIKATFFNVVPTKKASVRNITQIFELIRKSTLSQYVKDTALTIFYNFTQIEAKIHGISNEEIILQELGSTETIINIIGTCICLEYLDIKNIFVIQLFTGSGFIRQKQDDSITPIPTPVVAELLANFELCASDIKRQLVTPEGAAILHTLAVKRPKDEVFRYETTSYGVNSNESETPNFLRIYIYDDFSYDEEECLSILETDIDDISPQILSYVCEKLIANGAVSAWITPIFLQKGRPAHLLSAIVKNNLVDLCKKIIFSETSSTGICIRHILRTSTQSEIETIATHYGSVRCRLNIYQGKIIKLSANYEDCRLLAKKNNIPLKQIQEEAVRIASFKHGL